MRNKADILKEAKEKGQYRPSFLMAWARFLNTEELVSTDNVEVMDAYDIHSQKCIDNWNKNVLEFNETNVRSVACLDLEKILYSIKNKEYGMVDTYKEDIGFWISVLGKKVSTCKDIASWITETAEQLGIQNIQPRLKSATNKIIKTKEITITI